MEFELYPQPCGLTGLCNLSPGALASLRIIYPPSVWPEGEVFTGVDDELTRACDAQESGYAEIMIGLKPDEAADGSHPDLITVRRHASVRAVQALAAFIEEKRASFRKEQLDSIHLGVFQAARFYDPPEGAALTE